MSELKPCNKCGKESKNQYVNESSEVCFKFGYGSNKDGISYKLFLCDDCFDEFIASFKIAPEIDDPYAHWNEEADAWATETI